MSKKRIQFLSVALFAIAVLALAARATVSPTHASQQDPCGGLQVVKSKTLLCTHGGDPRRAFDTGPDSGSTRTKSAALAPAAPCPGGGVSGKRVEVIYAVPQDRPNNFAASLPAVRAAVDDADSFLDESTPSVPGQHYRWLCQNGSDVTVRNVTLIPVGGDAQFTYSDMVFSLQNQVAQGLGPTDFLSADRVYLVFVDQISGVYPFGGQGDIRNDDSPNPASNLNQSGPHYSLVNGFSGFVAEHEIGHNIGAVQLSAPHSSGAWHCFEENDAMCYSDGGPYFTGGGALIFNCPTLPGTHFDCGQDDYYDSQSPPFGTYLATHWNVSKSAFLTEPVQIVCTWASQNQPDSPLELNSVAAGSIAKSVAMEKEVFQCFDRNDPHANVVRTIDVETFVEVIERARQGKVKTIDKRVEVAACTKDRSLLNLDPARLQCDTKDVTLQDVPKAFLGCALLNLPHDPVEMNTVSLLGGKLVKTIKVEKEIWDCDATILDLYLFTEIVEARSNGGFQPVSKTFEAIICQKERATSGIPPGVRCGTLRTS